jgi:UDP-2,3-diacylglucosamine pyrophosphatase LpxH
VEHRYLVVSDLHLADVEDHEDGWRYFKGSQYLFTEDFTTLLEDFAEESECHNTLILNGDIFDFDLVASCPKEPTWPVSPSERGRGLRPTPEKSAWKLAQILGHHAEFMTALVSFVAAGNRIVYVLGNHDRELHFPAVEEVLRNELESTAQQLGGSFDQSAFTVEPWFFYEEGRIYVEHGHQYDYYTSFKYILDPVVHRRGGEELALPMGNISNRLLMSRMGYFNPHTTDYILNMYSYLAHWFRFYAFTRRNLLLSWLLGSFMTLRRLISTKRRLVRRPRGYQKRLEQQAEHTGISPEKLRALDALKRPPIAGRVFRIIREFWIDRLIMAIFMTGSTIALALVPIPLWIKLMVPLSCFPLLYFLYESLVQGETVFSAEAGVNRHAFPIAQLLEVPLVVFGHTHSPGLRPMGPNSTFVNTGTWAPMTSRPMGPLKEGYRNFLIAHCSKQGSALELGARVGPGATVP